ncbi:hypothetical protein M422DRAFT_105062, partial [Sphaerobolus stellatus SS14]
LSNNPEFTMVKDAILAGLATLRKYYSKADATSANIVCLILNPSVKMEYIKIHWDADWIAEACGTMEKLFDKYYVEPPSEAAEQNMQQKAPSPMKIGSGYGSSWLTASIQKGLAAQRRNSDPRNELAQYLSNPPALGDDDAVAWWGQHSVEYPTLSRIARDYLAIQGSAVPCERCFSSSALTGTNRRNHLLPKTFEALQILKNAYKAGDMQT